MMNPQYEKNEAPIIYLWGAGVHAAQVIPFLKYTVGFKISGIIDKNVSRRGQLFMGVPICSIADLESEVKKGTDFVLQLSVGFELAEEVKQEAIALGASNIVTVYEMERFWNEYKKREEELALQQEEKIEVALKSYGTQGQSASLESAQEGSIQRCYEQNVSLLQDYPYLFQKNFVEPSHNSYAFCPLNQEYAYLLHKESKEFEKIQISSKRETTYFFEHTDDCFYVENEWNQFNVTFLVDNVRCSEDVAKENHIYLYFENMEQFSLRLYYMDFGRLLEKEKLVFLIGEEEKTWYPMNFKEKFGIDYESMEFQEVRPEEIKRVAVQLNYSSGSGNKFLCDIFDNNGNMLGATWEFIHFPSAFYKENEQQYTVEEFLSKAKESLEKKDLAWLQQLYYQEISPNYFDQVALFVEYLETMSHSFSVHSLKDWMLLVYFADIRLKKRLLPTRIAPMLHHISHTSGIVSDRDLYPMLSGFPYFYPYSMTRDPVPRIASVIDVFTRQIKRGYLSVSNPPLFEIIYVRIQDIRYPAKILRFEDLKLNPRATLFSFCQYLSVPYEEKNMYHTDEGDAYSDARYAGFAKGFSVQALYKERFDLLTKEDCYFFEMIFEPFFELLHYKPIHYDGAEVSQSTLEAWINRPFPYEKVLLEVEDPEQTYEERVALYQKKRVFHLNYLMTVSKKVKDLKKCGFLQSFDLIVPKEEWLVNEPYINQKNLPKLEDTTVDFLTAPLLSGKGGDG